MMIVIRRSALACASLAGLLTLAPAAVLAQQPSPVTVQNAWARATPPGASTGAAYVTLTSPSGDKLTGISSPVAAKASVHETHMVGDVMRMRPIAGGLDLPAGKPVTLRPGGDHIMLEGLKAPLRKGQDVPLHLNFQKAPPLDIEAHVQAIGSSGPDASSGGHAGQASMPGMTIAK